MVIDAVMERLDRPWDAFEIKTGPKLLFKNHTPATRCVITGFFAIFSSFSLFFAVFLQFSAILGDFLEIFRIYWLADPKSAVFCGIWVRLKLGEILQDKSESGC